MRKIVFNTICIVLVEFEEHSSVFGVKTDSKDQNLQTTVLARSTGTQDRVLVLSCKLVGIALGFCKTTRYISTET